MRDSNIGTVPSLPAGVHLATGQEWWEASSPHTLAARVRKDRTVAAESHVFRLHAGRYGVLVRRLAPRPPAWRAPVLVALGVLCVGGLIGWGFWVLVRSGVLAAMVAAAAVGTLVRISGRRARCSGLHCSGCRH